MRAEARSVTRISPVITRHFDPTIDSICTSHEPALILSEFRGHLTKGELGMPIDRNTIAPAAQARYIRIGKTFGSDHTLAQLDRTLDGVKKYRDLMAGKGFTLTHEELTKSVRESLIAAGVVRAETRTDRKVTNAALLKAMSEGKAARFAAHSALDGARILLSIEGNNAVLEVDKALHDTRSAGADAEELERQLRQLANVCANESVRAKLGDNAATLETQLNNSIAALNAAREQKTGARGTPAETEYLDLLDGLAVELVRLARKAARAVARDLGQEAIATDLDLRELYKSTSRGADDEEEGGGGPITT